MQSLRNWLVVATIVIIASLGAYGAYYLYQKRVVEPTKLATINPSPKAGFKDLGKEGQTSSQPSDKNVLADKSTSTPTKQPETSLTSSDPNSPGIVVLEPQNQTTITSPVLISGWSKIQSGYVFISIKNPQGNTLGSGYAQSCPSFEACQFHANIPFLASGSKNLTIEVTSSNVESSEIYSENVSVGL